MRRVWAAKGGAGSSVVGSPQAPAPSARARARSSAARLQAGRTHRPRLGPQVYKPGIGDDGRARQNSACELGGSAAAPSWICPLALMAYLRFPFSYYFSSLLNLEDQQGVLPSGRRSPRVLRQATDPRQHGPTGQRRPHEPGEANCNRSSPPAADATNQPASQPCWRHLARPGVRPGPPASPAPNARPGRPVGCVCRPRPWRSKQLALGLSTRSWRSAVGRPCPQPG